ncbi:MAG: molybdopterin-dependent oxidoreductase [Actinomycetia bacterium]|nr:molybdopterin-dependent oxidoreductase [Actinomycetes bacterium]
MLRRMLVPAVILLLPVLALAGCGDNQVSPVTATIAVGGDVAPSTVATNVVTTASTASGAAPSTTIIAPGDLQPIVVPTLPAEIPGYTELDPATGLHVTGEPQVVDRESYRLKVTGKVAKPLSLTYDELRLLPKMTASSTLVCVGFFSDTTTWSGVPLATILGMAGVQPQAERIKMVSADGYSSTIDLERALVPENLLAYEWMGGPLPVLHGFPVRAVLPYEDGNYWVKWLLEIVIE